MALSINKPITPRHLISDAVRWMTAGDRVALLTLVAIEGSAPYPLGSQMLVNQRGEFLGQITGGCAEIALAEQAVKAITERQNCTQRYGLDSPFFDIQLPCGSGIDIFIDVATSLQHYQELERDLESRVQSTHHFDTQVGGFTKTYRPNERLIVLGQGPILECLCRLALASGFEVICIVQAANAIAPPEVQGLITSELQTGQSQFYDYCDDYTALVSLFHEHEYETQVLTNALASKAFYIGALGSRATQAKRLTALSGAGVDANQLERIHGPVGLDIQSETPAQIAISILAEIIQKMPKEPLIKDNAEVGASNE